MPPKATAKAAASNAVIRTGPKEVSVHPSKQARRSQAEKPTTQRALVLRNGKHGAMGSGEVIAHSKITGREKLDLLAEDLMKSALMSPFKMGEAMKVAQAQFDLYRDDIVNLKDPLHFKDLIDAELTARTRPNAQPRSNASSLAKLVGSRIHNSYMLASAWKLVADTLQTLANSGLTDTNIKAKLKSDDSIRRKYMALFDMVSNLVGMSLNHLSVLATTAPHYAQFFKARPSEGAANGEPDEIYFDWNVSKNLRTATQSFLDSIVLELCFPQGPIPNYVLYMLLNECLDESPHEAKRISTAMYAAMGDLAWCVQLQALLEAPLFGEDGEQWKKEPREMPEEYEKWIDAHFFSKRATSEITNWKDILNPWAQVRRKENLDKMWREINMNYMRATGIDVDRLWQLDEAFKVQPKWSSSYFDRLAEGLDEDEEGPDGQPRLFKKKKKTLALMAPGDEEDSEGSMPPLQSVSNSSEDDDYSDFDDDEEDDDENFETDESDYDTDEEDEIRELMKEAMDRGHECNMFDSNAPGDMDPLKEDEKKGNPFLKALGSLRGRLFKAEPKLSSTNTRTEPRSNARGAFRATRTGAPKSVPKTVPKPLPAGDGDKPGKTTMEEVEDEDADVGTAAGAAKKKKKKKGKKKKPAGASSPSAPSANFGASASTLHIPIAQTKAESTHSYLKTLEETKKDKVKSRPDHASIFSQDTEKKSGLFAKITKGLTGKDETGQKNPKYTWFSRLSKKATDSMHQLLRTSEEAGKQPSPMKWDTFVKLMKEMGFEYDPSTAGSSVRFDPPSPTDHPFMVHRPHPDSTLTPKMLRIIGARLKRRYGWDEEDFIQQTLRANA